MTDRTDLRLPSATSHGVATALGSGSTATEAVRSPFGQEVLVRARGHRSNGAGHDVAFSHACLQGSTAGMPAWVRYLTLTNDLTDACAGRKRAWKQGWSASQPAQGSRTVS